MIEPAANDPGPTPDLDCPPDCGSTGPCDPGCPSCDQRDAAERADDEHFEPIHKRPTKRGPYSPFDEIDNRCPPDSLPLRTVRREP